MVMTPTYDRNFWEERWSEVLREHGDRVADRPPNAHLIDAASHLQPGLALDAGCGHGSDTFWLAAHGWRVTAVDFSTAVLTHARSTAESMGVDIAERIEWVEGDLSTWTPQPEHYDLVVSLYVHVAGSVEAMVQRLATGVAPGGTLFLVGHRPIDPATGAETAAAGQLQVSVDRRSLRSTPTIGTLSSPRTVHEPWSVPASTPSSAHDVEAVVRR